MQEAGPVTTRDETPQMSGRYARVVTDAPAADDSTSGNALARAPWAEPAELVALRAGLALARERIERAARQIELAAGLELRLEPLLKAPSLPPPSPARVAAELEATRVLLQAELYAADLLNGPDAEGINPEAANVLASHLQAMAEVELGLAELGRRAAGERQTPAPGPVEGGQGGPRSQRSKGKTPPGSGPDSPRRSHPSAPRGDEPG